MSSHYLTWVEQPQVPPSHAADMAQGLYAALAQFLAPALIELDAAIDKRLVRTKRLSHLLHCAKWSGELIRQRFC